jgi:hypothetical protein
MRRAVAVLLPFVAMIACGSEPGGGGSGGSGGSYDWYAGGSGGSSSRALNCVEIFGCVDRCAGDADCQGECRDAADPAGLDSAIGLASCLLDNACERTSCAPCADELEACIQDGLASLDCSGLSDCLGVCMGDEECAQEVCLFRAEPGAVAKLEAYRACRDANGCATDECITRWCLPERQACFGH